MNKLFFLLPMFLWGSCSSDSTEKHQKNRNHVIDVRSNIQEIAWQGEPIHAFSEVLALNECLLICDYHSFDKHIHIVDKNNFKFLASTAPKGQGPGEIANIGQVVTDENHRRFYVNDHGKQKIFRYDLDSVLAHPDYRPVPRMSMNEAEFPSGYHYIHDTLCIGAIIKPTGNYGFNKNSARWNMNTGEIKPMPDFHPEIKKKRYDIAVSPQHGICVESYQRHDLLTIRTLSGDLKYNIYGPHWEISTQKKISYYGEAIFCKDKILVLYLGKDAFSKNPQGDPVANIPDQIMVFDLNGEYIKTLDIGHPTSSLCYDEANNRLILSMNDEIQFGCLNLEGVID